jgi:hypothetical protein
MVFRRIGNGSQTVRLGTFTFTGTEITFIPKKENNWQGYTQKYTLQDGVLKLESEGKKLTDHLKSNNSVFIKLLLN